MKEIKGSLWSFFGKPGYMVMITTNGFVRKDGCAVMGRGCAFEAARRFPDLPKLLGESIQKNGNVVTVLCPGKKPKPFHTITTFPVKHNWYEDADPELIRSSAVKLHTMASVAVNAKFILPRPGCGNGHLKWEDVRPLVADLPDNVLVISPYREGKWL